FKTFGCLAVGLEKTQKNKFQAKGKELIFVGYSKEVKGYRLYDPETDKIVVKRDVQFDENYLMGGHDKIDFYSLINDGIDENIEQPVKHDYSNSNSSDSESSLSFEDADSEVGQSIDDANNDENKIPIYGPGRPWIERTGRPGRPSKIKNQINVLQETEEVAVPENL
ncbi:hypothetical protein KR222_009192, partial [Zaprionus bogoriensis]